MKIFIDSADINEIREAFSWGIVDGVTTNPSLIKTAMEKRKEKLEMAKYIEEILKAANNCPVSLEVDGELEGRIREEQMVKEARTIYERFKGTNSGVNIKIPINPAMSPEEDNQFEGLKAIKKLKEEGIPINATLIMTPEQALLAAKAGARYVSPFMGRIDDYVKEMTKENKKTDIKGCTSGMELVKEIKEIIGKYHFKTEIIGASVRNVYHVRELAKIGTDIATIPFNVLKEMVGHPKTYEGVKKFKEDADNVPEYKNLLKG